MRLNRVALYKAFEYKRFFQNPEIRAGVQVRSYAVFE